LPPRRLLTWMFPEGGIVYGTDSVAIFCLSHFTCIVVPWTSVGSMQPAYCHFLTQHLLLFHFNIISTSNQSQDSSVGIAAGYRLNGPGLFPDSDRCLHSVPPSLLPNGYRVSKVAGS
jgi:hypothetical protein